MFFFALGVIKIPNTHVFNDIFSKLILKNNDNQIILNVLWNILADFAIC